jgi:rubrerythrin
VQAMESLQEEAFVTVIGFKIRSLIVYRAISSKIKDLKIKRLFELMANEVVEQLQSFCTMIQNDKEVLVNILGRSNTFADRNFRSLLALIDENITGEDALRIALNEEKESVERFSLLVDTIGETPVHKVFVRILHETNKQIDMISAESYHLNMMKRKGSQYVNTGAAQTDVHSGIRGPFSG